jgi:ABC-type branched-subunit amino acid transport system ATPase component
VSLLEVSGITVGYGETEILHGVSVVIEQGEMVTIIGPNGSGKSTLLKAVLGLVTSKKGHITFQGEDISGMAPEAIVRKGLCYVPQSDNVFPALSVQENLEMGAFIRTDDYRPRIRELYGLFPDLGETRKVKASTLSGGQRQMLALARALMLDPVLLLLDEPSAGLAPTMVTMIFQKILEINSTGVAVVLVEQNALKALEISSRGYVMAAGRTVLEDRGENLLKDPEVARLYLGSRTNGNDSP